MKSERDVVIKANSLSRYFQQYKKAEGLKGAIRNVFHRDYYTIKSVDNVTFNIKKGELVGFIGPNGAGKTTTLKMLSGVLHPTSGEVSVLGYFPADRKKEYLKQIGFVMGQKSQLLWELPPIDTFKLNKEIYGISNVEFKRNLEELVSIVDIEKILNVPVRRLSLGQRMKCELVASLIHNPSILFLDEPTIGLDIVAQKNIRNFIKEVNRKNENTVMLTSHYMDDVQEICDRLIVINDGKIVYDGSISGLTKKYAKFKYVKCIFSKGVSRERLIKFGEIVNYESDGAVVLLKTDREKNVSIVNSLFKSFNIVDVDITEMPLEDIVSEIYLEVKE